MQAMLLCGGQGSRIRDVSELVPKPMLQIGGRPILWHIMHGYAAHGVKDFVLCLGYKGAQIREFFLNFRAMTADCSLHLGRPDQTEFHQPFAEQDWRVTLVDTGEHTMTGGRVWRSRQYVTGDHFCLTYGDGVSDIDIAALIEHHRASGRAATVTAVHVAGRFGELTIDETGGVERFSEKPSVTAGRVSAGFFVFDNRRIWDFMDDRETLVLEREPMDRLVEAGELGIYAHDGFWQCMDTPREYALLNDLWERGDAPWKTW